MGEGFFQQARREINKGGEEKGNTRARRFEKFIRYHTIMYLSKIPIIDMSLCASTHTNWLSSTKNGEL